MLTALRAHRGTTAGGVVRRRSLRSLGVTVVTALVATFGVVGLAAPATAVPGPSITVTPAGDLDASVGQTLTVVGSGFAAALEDGVDGIYLNLGTPELWTPGTAPARGGWVASSFVPKALIAGDGTFSATMTVPADAAVAGTSYRVASFCAHGCSASERGLDAVSAELTFVAPPAVPALSVDVTSLNAAAGGSIQVTGTGYGAASDNGFYVALVEEGLWTPGTMPTPGTGSMAAFVWLRVAETATTPLVLDEDGGWTATLAVEADKLTAGTEYEVITFVPHMEATNRALDAASATIAATGTPVDPDPDPEGPGDDRTVEAVAEDGTVTVTGSGFAESAAKDGLYISVSKAGLSGISAAQADAEKVADFWATTSGRFGATLKADGTFTVAADFTPTAGVDYAVYIADVNGHAPIDLLSVPVEVKDSSGSGGSAGAEGPDPSTPATPSAPTTGGGSVDGLPTSGDAAGNARPGERFTITAGGFEPNETGIVLELHSDPVVLATGLTADADGVVRYTFTVPAGTPAGEHTLVLAGASHVASVPLAVAEPLPVCVARTVTGATLTWGVKADFRSYVTGSVASGSISTSGVSGSGPWTWSGGTGTFNTVDTIGRASFSGGVTFTGHGGVLDVEVSNLRVQVNTAFSGTLIGDLRSGSTSRSGIALATLNLGAGERSTSDGQVSWTGVPATLTNAGAAGFEGFYTAGAAMDAVSFTMPLGAETACTSTSGANAGKYLANTGSDLDLAGLALLLLLGGGLLLVVARRLPRLAGARVSMPVAAVRS